MKEDIDEYQGKDYMDDCLNQYGRVSKEHTTSIKERFNTDECLDEYGWVSKEDTDEYQRKV